MSRNIILDTGVIVALINRKEDKHEWVKETLKSLSLPFLTCESVITESCFLLQNVYDGEETVLNLLASQKIQIPFQLIEEATEVKQLMAKYKSVPMSLADACLVRMSELIESSTIFTLDSDFYVYRQNKNQSIPLTIPD